MNNIETGQLATRQINPQEALRLDGNAQTILLGGDGGGHSVMDVPANMMQSLGTIELGGQKADVMARLDMGSVTHFALVDTHPGESFPDDGYPPDDRYALVRIGGTGQDMQPVIKPDGSYVMAFMSEPDTTHFLGRQPEKVSTDIQSLAATHDPVVSRRHAGIAINEDGGIKILDQSSHGTKVTIKTTVEAAQAAPEAIVPNPEEAEEIGGVAVEEVVNVEPVVAEVQQTGKASESAAEELELPTPVDTPVIVGNEEEIKPDPASDGRPGSDKQREEQAPQDKEFLKQQAMRELREEWGMPEDFTEQQAVERLMAEHDELKGMIRQLRNFAQAGQDAAIAIYRTLDGRGIVYLGNNGKDRVDQFLLGKASKQIDGFPALESSTLLPKRVRETIAQHQLDLKKLRNTWQQATYGFRNGRPSLEGDSARTAAGYLSGSVPELQRTLTNADRQIQKQIEHITGRPFGAKEVEAIKEEIIYRTPEYAQLAKELEKGVTPERLEEITQQFEAAINTEVGMVDDPNSPRQYFGERIISNTHTKERAQVQLTGRLNAPYASPRRYVAELMTDMLRGKFDTKRALDSILLDNKQTGGVRLGMHRAAALAMLYGKDWPQIAAKMGHKIETENSRPNHA